MGVGGRYSQEFLSRTQPTELNYVTPPEIMADANLCEAKSGFEEIIGENWGVHHGSDHALADAGARLTRRKLANPQIFFVI